MCLELLSRYLRKILDCEVDESETNEDEGKNPAAVALGKLGGQKGGKARAESLTAEQRKAIAKKAAESRWKSKPNKAPRG